MVFCSWMLRGANRMPGILYIFLRGKGMVKPCTTLLLTSEVRSFGVSKAPLWFLKPRASLTFFAWLNSWISLRGLLEPSFNSFSKQGQFGWRCSKDCVVFSVLERKWEQLPTSDLVHMPLWSGTAWKLWMSHDRGGWSLILQSYECMWMHIWILRGCCSIWCLYLGTKILYCCPAIVTWGSMANMGDSAMWWNSSQWILWLLRPLAASREMRWIWCKHAPDGCSTDHLKWQTLCCMINKWGQHGWCSLMLIAFAWGLLRMRVEVFIRFGSIWIPTRG